MSYEMTDTRGKGSAVYTHLHYNLTCEPAHRNDRLCLTDGLVVFERLSHIYFNATTTQPRDSYRPFFVWNSTQSHRQHTHELRIQFTVEDTMVTAPVDYIRTIRLTMFNYSDYTTDSLLKEFTFETNIEEALRKSEARVDVLQVSNITNPSNSVIRESISQEKAFRSESQLTFANKYRQMSGKNTTTQVGGQVGGIMWNLFSADIRANFEHGIYSQYTNYTERTGTTTTSAEHVFKLTREITVNPYESVEYSAYLSIVKDLTLPYRAVNHLSVRTLN
ncbi:unnamed protein product [Oppiella nova]|uniref:Uncharacterized protein n=1 Tax=Oppiella nova TaxID=334625 RepID=A0A7R9MH15_9ACAR|nr:unnamed protein product [Oppiella nova]CAG2177229.1 unnamed protein product [Oppiella nova]